MRGFVDFDKNKVSHSFAIEPSQLDEVREASEKQGISMSAYVCNALDYYQKQTDSTPVTRLPDGQN